MPSPGPTGRTSEGGLRRIISTHAGEAGLEAAPGPCRETAPGGVGPDDRVLDAAANAGELQGL
jgi:hypothetical protein